MMYILYSRVFINKYGYNNCRLFILMGRPRRSWIGTEEECLRKRGLDVRQARRMVHDRIADSHIGECAGSHSVGRVRKRWIDTVED